MADLSRDELMMVYEMMGHPGWKILMEEMEGNLATVVLAGLGLKLEDPAFEKKAAYWQGRADALWAIGQMEGKIAALVRVGDEEESGMEPPSSDSIIRRIVKRLFKGGGNG